MKDYKISELIRICKNNVDCKQCPALSFCEVIDPQDFGDNTPHNWNLDLEKVEEN